MNEQEIIPEGGIIEKPRPPSKADLKRQQIFQERMQRLVGKGLSPQQAVERIQREDYERLPPNEKIKRLEGAIVGNFQAVARDVHMLRANETSLADIMDVNFRAFEKMLVKLGLPVEEQRKLLVEAEAEIKAEQAARQAQEAAAQEQANQQAVQASIDVPGPQELPEGATVFGN